MVNYYFKWIKANKGEEEEKDPLVGVGETEEEARNAMTNLQHTNSLMKANHTSHNTKNIMEEEASMSLTDKLIKRHNPTLTNPILTLKKERNLMRGTRTQMRL